MLVSTNNRQLGRGAGAHGSAVECLAAVQRLRAAREHATPVVAATGGTGRWSWRLELDGAPVAVSSRAYLRLRECQYNLSRFLEAVASAEIAEGLRVSRPDRRVTMSGPGAERLADGDPRVPRR